MVLFPPLHVGHPVGFALEAALEDLGLPHEGQVWRWCSCLDRRGSGSTRYSGELAARAAGNIVSRRVWQPVLANMLQYSCLETPCPSKLVMINNIIHNEIVRNFCSRTKEFPDTKMLFNYSHCIPSERLQYLFIIYGYL